MKPFIVHLLTLLAICFVLSCCKHEPPTEPAKECQYDNNIGEMKRWYYFKVGTWWVYQEETTGALDTITVYYNVDGVDSGIDYFEWYGHSTYDGYNYKYRFNTSYTIHCLTALNCDCHKINRSKTMPGDFVGSENLFLFPIILSNYNNLLAILPNGEIIPGTSTVTDVNLEFTIGEDTLRNVVRWNVTGDDSNEGWPSEYYLAQDVGFVRITHESPNFNWKLIEYHIEL